MLPNCIYYLCPMNMKEYKKGCHTECYHKELNKLEQIGCHGCDSNNITEFASLKFYNIKTYHRQIFEHVFNDVLSLMDSYQHSHDHERVFTILYSTNDSDAKRKLTKLMSCYDDKNIFFIP